MPAPEPGSVATRDQAKRLRQRLCRGRDVARLPQVPAQPLLQRPDSNGAGVRVGGRGVDRTAAQIDRGRVVTDQHGGIGGVLEGLGPVEVDAGFHAQLECSLVRTAGIGERVDPLGGQARVHPRRNRPIDVAGRIPVIGELCRADRHAADLAAPRQAAPQMRRGGGPALRRAARRTRPRAGSACRNE
jgi:hypothetical protein